MREREAFENELRDLGLGARQWGAEALEATKPVDLDRAVRLNLRFGRDLGWQPYRDRIAALLGLGASNLDDHAFAAGVAAWQKQQRLRGKPDGIIGPDTWRAIKMRLGDVRLVFDGFKLCVVTRRAPQRCLRCWRARSGQLDASHDTQVQDYDKKDYGPIVPGRHRIDTREIQQRIDASGRERSWPGGETSWGNFRVVIHPQKGTKTFNRTGFFIHGGSRFGSVGCVDLQANSTTFFDYLRQSVAFRKNRNTSFDLIVDYTPPGQPGSVMPAACLEPAVPPLP
jgi:hypothetical protein